MARDFRGTALIKYIGSKRVLVPMLRELITGLPEARSVVDLFSGTARVSHALKDAGMKVVANDHNAYAATLARCYVAADLEDVGDAAQSLIDEANALPGDPGYFTRTFCEESRYIQPHNGARIDAVRDWIDAKDLPPELHAVVLVSLMEAADRVDSTTGVQMAYLKSWARRSFNDLQLRMPKVLPAARHGKGEAHELDALTAATSLTGDVGYLDPPYNQHKYVGNYHVWETLVRWDAPETYGIACKRVDCKERRSVFNSRPRIRDALKEVVGNLDVRHLVVSFSNEGFVSREEMIELLSTRGEVFVFERDHKRYVGARIGIYSPGGDKVGSVSHTRNKEWVFVVPETPDAMVGVTSSSR